MIAAAIFLEAAALWARSGRVGGDIVVRCQAGHRFTTIWIPAVSLKSIRLGWWRVQYCPVGHHWSVVSSVKTADLTDEQRHAAGEHHDIRIP